METKATANPDALRIALAGELTVFTAAAVREQLLAALGSAAEIEVDLAQVSEIDSAGVQLLLAAKQEAGALQAELGFTGHSAPVLDILGLCDLAARLDAPLPARP